MADPTNPRKITTSGGMTVVSIPKGLLEQAGLEKGDQVVLEATNKGFEARKVEWEVA